MVAKRNKVAALILIPLLWSILSAIPPLLPELKQNYIDGLVYDLALMLRAYSSAPAQSSDVVIIGIDEDSLADHRTELNAEIFGAQKTLTLSQMPRSLMHPVWAELSKSLLDQNGINARRLGFDMFFVWQPASLVGGKYEQAFNRQLLQKRDQIFLARGKHKLMPLYENVLHQNLGSTALPIDPDGITRRIPRYPETMSEGALLPSLPALISGYCHPKNNPDCNRIPKEFLLTPRNSITEIPSFRLIDILKCLKTDDGVKSLSEIFQDKIVLVGTTWPGEDIKETPDRFLPRRDYQSSRLHGCEFKSPLSPNSEGVPAVFVLASAVNAILKNEMPVKAQPLVIVAITLALVFFISFLALRWQPWNIVWLCMGTICVLLAISTVSINWNFWLPTGLMDIAIVLSALGTFAYRYVITDRSGRQIREAFNRYLAPPVIDRLVDENRMPERGGEMRHMTVWISDIASYSTIAENLSPPDLVKLLNSVFTEISQCIEQYDGFVTQFAGDAVVGGFGAPLDDTQHAEHAVMAALECVKRIDLFNDSVSLPYDLNLGIRIGISSGDLLVGNVGSEHQLNYTFVGDDINLSARLEGINKIYGTQILINGETRKLCSDDLVFREIDTVKVVGRNTPAVIFEPLGRRGEIPTKLMEISEAFSEGLKHYRKRDFAKAKNVFEKLQDTDAAAKVFVARTEAYIKNPPSDDWDGVHVLDSK